MSIFSRLSIPRGIKLPVQLVFNPIRAIRDAIVSVNLDANNLAQNSSPWHVHLNMPNLDSRFFDTASTDPDLPGVELCFPFIMLPPQEQYNTSGLHSPETVRLALDSVSLSFDQRREAGGIVDFFATNPATIGDVTSAQIPAYNITIRISEKQPTRYGGSAPYLSERDVFTATLPSLGLEAQSLDNNPFTWGNLGRQIDPYKTYIVRIAVPGLRTISENPNLWACLVSLNVDLHGTSTMMQRDTGTDVQNIPTLNYGEPTPDTLLIGVPEANDTISAEGRAGINSALLGLDRKLLDRLWTGYGKDSSLPPYEQITQDAGYEVICVPLFQNVSFLNRMLTGSVQYFPFYNGNPATMAFTADRRIIPIEYPLTIHHVLLVMNYAAPKATTNAYDDRNAYQSIAGQLPTSTTLVTSVGVGIGTGLRGDLYEYQQVAYQSWTNGNVVPIVDRFKQAYHGQLTSANWDYQIMPVPLVGEGGAGPTFQGKPFFVGRSSTAYMPRNDVDGHAPYTQGCEQWLEVRMTFDDPSGIAQNAGSPYETIAGVGGHYVLILAKKTVSGGTFDLPL